MIIQFLFGVSLLLTASLGLAAVGGGDSSSDDEFNPERVERLVRREEGKAGGEIPGADLIWDDTEGLRLWGEGFGFGPLPNQSAPLSGQLMSQLPPGFHFQEEPPRNSIVSVSSSSSGTSDYTVVSTRLTRVSLNPDLSEVVKSPLSPEEERIRSLETVCAEARVKSPWVHRLFEAWTQRLERTQKDFGILWGGALEVGKPDLDLVRQSLLRSAKPRHFKHPRLAHVARTQVKETAQKLGIPVTVAQEWLQSSLPKDHDTSELPREVKARLELWMVSLTRLSDQIGKNANPWIQTTTDHIMNALQFLTGKENPSPDDSVLGQILHGILTREHQPGYHFERRPSANIEGDTNHPYASSRLQIMALILCATHGVLNAGDNIQLMLQEIFGEEWLIKESTFIEPFPLVLPQDVDRSLVAENPFVTENGCFLFFHNGFMPDEWRAHVPRSLKPFGFSPESPGSFITRGANLEGIFTVQDMVKAVQYQHFSESKRSEDFGEGILNLWNKIKKERGQEITSDHAVKEVDGFFNFYNPYYDPKTIEVGSVYVGQHYDRDQWENPTSFFNGTEERQAGVFLGLTPDEYPKAVILSACKNGGFVVRTVPKQSQYVRVGNRWEIVYYAQPQLTPGAP